MSSSSSTFFRRLSLILATSAITLSAATGAVSAQDKIVLIINGALGDKSFFDSAALGLKAIQDKYGNEVETRVLEVGDDPSTWEPVLLDVSEQDWDLIIAGTFAISETLGDIAMDYPDNRYVLFDATLPFDSGDYDNVYAIEYKQNEGAYLGGMLAAGLLSSGALGADSGNALGFLGGMDIPVINDFLVGYIAGAQSITPDVKVTTSYAGSFTDAAKGKELGLAQFRSGVALGFIAASQAGLGQISAAGEMNRYILGVDSDQEAIFNQTDPHLASRVVSSVLKNVDVSLIRAYELFRANELPFGSAETIGLAEGAVGIVEGGNAAKLASPELLALINETQGKIAAGEITVPTAFGMTTDQLNTLRDSVRP